MMSPSQTTCGIKLDYTQKSRCWSSIFVIIASYTITILWAQCPNGGLPNAPCDDTPCLNGTCVGGLICCPPVTTPTLPNVTNVTNPCLRRRLLARQRLQTFLARRRSFLSRQRALFAGLIAQ
ncbi:hypothetical protein DdX_21822 [Ditylenchus destructor]|uniref:Uncharacterized protein n=1 Tax=Ditylenchus destructor TaxID=166010 RepID=A0AAD4MEC5_9BILA|nr:hypothetical protein DdX_21822 [Ditylenchus destructor]